MEASQLFSRPLQRLAEGTLQRFKRGRRSAARSRTVARICMVSSQPLSDVEAREPRDPAGSALSGKRAFARYRSLKSMSAGKELATRHLEASQKLDIALVAANADLHDASLLV